MNYDESDFFESTPPRTRARGKGRGSGRFNNAGEFEQWKGVEPKGRSVGLLSREYINSPRSSMRKKKTEIRSHQRDAKRHDAASSAADDDDAFGDYNFVIGSRAAKMSDILTLGSPRPLRCLSTSCVSEKDLADDEAKSSSKGSKAKSKKRPQRSRPSKPSPSDQMKYRYIQRLRQVIAAGDHKQCQVESERIKSDAKSPKYEMRRNELIWLELQAWFNNQTLMKQDQILYDARQNLVTDVLSFVSVFQFEPKYISFMAKLKSDIDVALEQIPEATCESCSIYVPSDKPKIEIPQNFSTNTINIKFGDKNEDGNDPHENDIPDLDIKTERDVFEDNAIKKYVSYIVFPSDEHLSAQDHAVNKVGEVLKLLCIIENLYPSTSMLAMEYPYYISEEFQSKVQALCCWYNITSDLKGKFATLMHVLSSASRNSTSTSQDYETYGDVDLGELKIDNVQFLSGPDAGYVNDLFCNYANRLLKRRSVKSILYEFLRGHFASLFRAKMNMLPRSCYGGDNEEMQVEEVYDERKNQQYCHISMEDEMPVFQSPECHVCWRSVTASARKSEEEKFILLFQKIENILLTPEKHLPKERCLKAIFEKAFAVSSSEFDSALFGLPTIKQLYLFFPSAMFAIMKHCMHLRMKQAMPFFNNSGSSVCLLTAKQLVMESKEMLECGLLARDVMHFFVSDIFKENLDENIASTLSDYEEDLHSMINTYLDFVNTWLVRMQQDLPHAPRGFQEILEQEWQFACDTSPHIDFNCIIMCACRFIKITADIVGSTREFLLSAVTELVQSQTDANTPSAAEEQHYNEDSCDQSLHSPQERKTSDPVTPQNFYRGQCSSKGRAGILWFHRQRSESPHLSRHNSMQSNDSMTRVASPVELSWQISSSSSSSSSSLPWLHYKYTSQPGYQKRYLFELCRAVRDLFNETRERATRILCFGKRLRKTLEPAIGYDMLQNTDLANGEPEVYCSYCQLFEALIAEGYVLVDLSNMLLKTNWQCGVREHSDADVLDLQHHWLFVPPVETKSSQDLETGDTDFFKNLWQLVERALFDHMKVSYWSRSNQDNDTSSNRPRYIIFVKKPPENTTDSRRQSEVSFCVKKRAKPRGKKATEPPKRRQKTKSEGNLQLQFNSNGANYCINRCIQDGKCAVWSGEVFKIDGNSSECASFIHRLTRSVELNHDFTVVSAAAYDVGIIRKELNNIFLPFAKLAIAQMPIVRGFKVAFDKLRQQVLDLCSALMDCIQASLSCLEAQSDKILLQRMTRSGSSDTDSWRKVKSEVNEVMQSCFNFAFDFFKEATRMMSGDFRKAISKMHLEVADQWMSYVLKHRETGKGRRPRWANQGLSFIVSLDSGYLLGLNDNEFLNLKQKIDKFIQHLIGDAKKGRNSSDLSPPARETRSSSTLQVPQTEVQQVLRSLSSPSPSETTPRSPISYEESMAVLTIDDNLDEDSEDEFLSPIERVRNEVERLEAMTNKKRFAAGIIGRVSDTHKKNPIVNLGVRTVNFRWRRGARVGEGAFGRVYTCVNVDTGIVLAMKEVKFQPNDHQKIRSAVDEYTNFEGIKHENLVQYYGVELHRDEMYIFMEYCDGGTLGEVCKISLPEPMVRRYTSEILAAVHTLHSSGIVHRDIKGSNIFLTSAGVIKLGDFGSAIKLKDIMKTTPGEMVTHIGTTLPYAAPEVINASEKAGYGRASDIWSLGCVVIEMASGKQPWHELERFQVMFRIGSGESPPVPNTLSEEGKNFIKLCTIPDPTKRRTAEQLLGHPFVKVPENDGTF